MTPLEQALRLRERLAPQTTEVAAAALDRISTAVMNIAPDGRIRYANRRARALLEQGEGLSLRRQRLHLDDPDAGARLQTALEAARRGDRADAVLVPAAATDVATWPW